VRSCEERLHFWRQLRGLAGLDAQTSDSGEMAERIRAELLAKVSASLGLGGGVATDAAGAGSRRWHGGGCRGRRRLRAGLDRIARMHGLRRVHQLAPKAFAYNDQKKAVVINPKGAKFADIVKAAEKCTAGCIHPGTPWNMGEAGVEKLMARAAKFN
jgi:pyruvate-ferredoxin/flavodoxin oxidoreductase